jgi:hypothetical protein
MISVITPSVRPEGLRLVEKALNRQVFRDFEWIVNDKRYEGRYWGVYRAYNDLVRQAKGDLLISWQDHTFADPDCLEKFWLHYQQEPKTIVSGVGNKYSDETFMVKTWQDPRERTDQGTYYKCFPNDIELNLASFPRESIYAVGGFDEYMDFYSSLCGLDVLQRLDALGGYDFKLDQTIKSYSTEHGRLPKWEENSPFHGAYDERVRDLIAKKEYPVLNYLRSKV